MSKGQVELDRLYANAEKRDTLDKTFGVERARPEDKPWPIRTYGVDDYSRDVEDDGS